MAEAIRRSFITLKALTFAPTGGIIAAPTTLRCPSSSEASANWDYRYCWVRDATFVLYALMNGGFKSEAAAWRDWLLRAVAGDPSKLQVMYGPAGRAPACRSSKLPWLPGYERSGPVRIGNAAVVAVCSWMSYGEVIDTLYLARLQSHRRRRGLLAARRWAPRVSRICVAARGPGDLGGARTRARPFHPLESNDLGGVRSRDSRRFERFPAGRTAGSLAWACAPTIHDEICEKAFDRTRNMFTQFYGSLGGGRGAAADPPGRLPLCRRSAACVARSRRSSRDLLHDGFSAALSHQGRTVRVDGLPEGEGAFLACTFLAGGQLHAARPHRRGA